MHHSDVFCCACSENNQNNANVMKCINLTSVKSKNSWKSLFWENSTKMLCTHREYLRWWTLKQCTWRVNLDNQQVDRHFGIQRYPRVFECQLVTSSVIMDTQVHIFDSDPHHWLALLIWIAHSSVARKKILVNCRNMVLKC